MCGKIVLFKRSVVRFLAEICLGKGVEQRLEVADFKLFAYSKGH